MAFWTKWFGKGESRGDLPQSDHPGDPDGVEIQGGRELESFSRSLPVVAPNAWDGWPADWATGWDSSQTGLGKLIDTAWACIDLNAKVLATMPLYRLQGGKVADPKPWMINPDPSVYVSRVEFFKQLFFDWQCGEAFVYSMEEDKDNKPVRMRVIPPWLVNVTQIGTVKTLKLGSEDVTDRMLHIRYCSTLDRPHGIGPLDVAGSRVITAGLLQRYARTLAETGGVPHYWLSTDRQLNDSEADELLRIWLQKRSRNPGAPAVASGGSKLNSLSSMSAKEMALLELSQFTESRIAILLGTPPFLVGLPSGGDSMTYSNVSQIFDFHDRSSLRPSAVSVMCALSEWALPADESAELNRDEYSRPDFASRITAYKTLMDIAISTKDPAKVAEVWDFIANSERFHGGAGAAAAALSGNNQAATQPDGGKPLEEIGNVSRIGNRYGF